jgi:hypothetical protein
VKELKSKLRGTEKASAQKNRLKAEPERVQESKSKQEGHDETEYEVPINSINQEIDREVEIKTREGLQGVYSVLGWKIRFPGRRKRLNKKMGGESSPEKGG